MKFNCSGTIAALGMTFADNKTITADSGVITDKSVPVAYAATLTTRTDNTNGVITLPAGHGITNGAKVDIYWGTTNLRTYASTSLSTNALTVSSGAGDNLPVVSTAVIVALVQEEPCEFAGANVQAIAAGGSTARSRFGFHALDDSAEEYAVKLGAGRSFYWDTEIGANGFTIPFDEAIGKVRFSHANTSAAEFMAVVAGVTS